MMINFIAIYHGLGLNLFQVQFFSQYHFLGLPVDLLPAGQYSHACHDKFLYR